METVDDVAVGDRGQREQATDAAPVMAGHDDRDAGQRGANDRVELELQAPPPCGIVMENWLVQHLGEGHRRGKDPKRGREVVPERDELRVVRWHAPTYR